VYKNLSFCCCCCFCSYFHLFSHKRPMHRVIVKRNVIALLSFSFLLRMQMEKNENVDQVCKYINYNIRYFRYASYEEKRRNKKKGIRFSIVKVSSAVPPHTYYTYLRMQHHDFSMHYGIERITCRHHLHSYQVLENIYNENFCC
jgi:hypothetical protein